MNTNSWPFRVSIQANMSDDITQIEVNTKNTASLSESNHLDFIISIFVDMASCGCFSGESINPNLNNFKNCFITLRKASGLKLIWTIKKINIDTRLYSVLFNLLESAGENIDAVYILTNIKEKQFKFFNAYPNYYSEPKFILLDDRLSKSFAIEIEFYDILEDRSVAKLNEILENWMIIGLLGGFRVFWLRPYESTIPLFEVFLIERKIVTFSIIDLTASDSCLDCLINCLCWISSNVANINNVKFE